MQINQKMQDAINKQINAELYSSYLYLSMASWSASENLKGFAHWLKKQSAEEDGHAKKLYEYVLDRGGKVILTAIDAPKTSWKSVQDMFENVYEHELKVTELINNLYKTAVDEKDNATQIFLQWYITEQVEEEAHAGEIVADLKMIGDSKGSLFMLDKKLGKRD